MVEIGCAGIHVAHLVALRQELIDAAEHVVAMHDRDLEPRRRLAARPARKPTGFTPPALATTLMLRSFSLRASGR